MSTNKKILLFTDWYEPGFKAGGPIQSCKNFVEALHDSFTLYIVTSDRDQGDQQAYPGIRTDIWVQKDPRIQIYYADMGKLTIAKLRSLVRFAGPDHIYLNSMYSYYFTIIPLWLKMINRLQANLVLAPRGMLHQGAIQFKRLKKKIFIQLMNWSGIPGKLTFQATDEQERKDILKYFPAAGRVVVLANFPRMEKAVWRPINKLPGELRCVFISRLAPKKNLLFLLTVLRQLPAHVNLHLTLRGDIEDDQYWQKCVSLINTLPSNISVRWEGPVPNEAVTEVLQQHHIFVLPTLGENYGHAIYEALLAGKPVLISDKTPWLQLPQKKAGYDLPLEHAAFEQALRSYLSMDQGVYDEWSRSAFEFAKTVQENSLLKEEYKKLFR